MDDLASVVLVLRPTHADTIPMWLGRAAHAWFLDSLRRLQPELSAAIHDGSGLKPFTVSSLDGRAQGEMLRLTPQQVYYLRLTTLHPDLTRLTLAALVPLWLDDGVCLHDQRFQVERIVTSAEDDPWSGKACYADLLAMAPVAGRTLKLTFVSPTLFHKTGDINYPLPAPELVFGSLQDRWMRFSPVPLPCDVKTQAVGVEVDSYQLSTQRVSFERAGRGAFTGFVGEVSYRVTSGDSAFKRAITTLAAYAMYAGVGIRTTMGLGQARALLPVMQRAGEG